MAQFHPPEQRKADKDAMTRGVCPETGRDLTGLSPELIRHHVAITFPRFAADTKADTDYARRARLVMQYADDREKAGER